MISSSVPPGFSVFFLRFLSQILTIFFLSFFTVFRILYRILPRILLLFPAEYRQQALYEKVYSSEPGRLLVPQKYFQEFLLQFLSELLSDLLSGHQISNNFASTMPRKTLWRYFGWNNERILEYRATMKNCGTKGRRNPRRDRVMPEAPQKEFRENFRRNSGRKSCNFQ